MKMLTLNKLSLSNFKGIANFTLNTEGRDVVIKGTNGSGKTSLMDAWLWLLFNKDSQGQTAFEIKTLNPDGTPVHGLEHCVEAELDINGKILTLKKVFKEKWVKRRGNAKAEFTGHETSYWVNDVPVKKSEYEARISEIINEDIFRLLTDPRHFNSLHWEKRRALLMEICGQISDEEIIASDKELESLHEILGERQLEEHRKIIAEKRKKINHELSTLPVRVSEVQNNLPDISGIVPDALLEDITRLRAERQDKQTELAGLENGGGIAEKKRQLQEIEAELLQIKNYRQGLQQEKILAARKELNEAESRVSSLQLQIDTSSRTLEKNKKDIAYLETRLAGLRQEWHKINGQKLEYIQDTVCPTCGQPLPEEKLAEAREKALADFNLKKASRLEEINREGKAVKEEYDRINVEILALEKQINETKERLKYEEEEAARLRVEVEKLQAEAGSYEADPAYQKKLAEKTALEEEIARFQAGNMENAAHIKKEIAELDRAIMALEEAQAKVKQYYQGQNRIEELKHQERELAAEYERLEQELYLCERFVRRKVELLEDKINSRFKLARFRLFSQLINGGLEEVCEVTYNGVPYPSLNNGARIQVGLDIIRTLCEHYGFYPPIWIDNRESVVQIPEMKNQLINLYVSAEDKSLRVEVVREEKVPL